MTISLKITWELLKKHYKNFKKELNEISKINHYSNNIVKINSLASPEVKFNVNFVRNMAVKNFETVPDNTDFKVPNVNELYSKYVTANKHLNELLDI